MEIRRLLARTAALFAASIAGPAAAVDGVLEINQACAVNTGCFNGDAPGFPVSISSAGSYRLTGNLSVSDPNTDGVDVLVSNVSIDLGGFEIAGPITCTGYGATLSCGSGGGIGVATPALSSRVSVSNGRVRGFGGGVDLGHQSRIDRLELINNRTTGAFLGTESLATRSRAFENGLQGFYFFGATAEQLSATGNGGVGIQIGSGDLGHCEVSSNGSAGIIAGGGVSIHHCEVSSNVSAGISASGSVSIHHCSVLANGAAGLEVAYYSVVDHVLAGGNGGPGISADLGAEGVLVQASVAKGNGAEGIRVDKGGSVIDSVAVDNGGTGISAEAACVLRGNTARSNGAGGIVEGGACTVEGNVVHNNTGDGITAGVGSTLARNTSRANTGVGIAMGNWATMRENTVTSNGGGTTTGGIDMGANSCNGTTSCP